MLSAKAGEVFEILRKNILKGTYATRFPSDREIMRRYSISKTTLRAVIGELMLRHIVERRSRSGTRLGERAQSLASGIFGVIFHDAKDPLIAAMVAGLSDAAKDAGALAYSTQVSNIGRSDKEVLTTAERMAKRYVDEHAIGVFLRPLPGAAGRKATKHVLKLLRTAKIPVVIMDVNAAKLPEGTGCDLVGAKGYRAPTKELAALLGDIAFRLMLQRIANLAHPPAEILLDPPCGKSCYQRNQTKGKRKCR
ncbi:MAG: GntR family transcriptional regulator [bacterium]|nr:GntR family transcriptional regulator [Candidatus Colisoma equi]